MSIYGIIAEYNPFHNGHKYLIDQARKKGADKIVAVMSGNFVQRGDTAVLSKFERTKQALSCGVDLVVELPTYWAMATAQKFSQGAVEILENIGIEMLIFGSECGDIERLMKTAYCIRSSDFTSLMRENLDKGLPPATAREKAVDALCGNGELLRSANDTLAVEYISAAKSLNSDMKFMAVKRQGISHDSNEVSDNYCSASKLRECIYDGKLDACREFMPKASFEILSEAHKNGKLSDIRVLDKTILTTLRTMTQAEYKALPDISEGIENRLYSAARISRSFKELLEFASTKRYTNARLRRLIMSAFLKESANEIPNTVPYIRVLGCNEKGAEILKTAREQARIPIIMRSTALKGNPTFEFEARATDIYAVTQTNPDPCGAEFTNGVIVKKV